MDLMILLTILVALFFLFSLVSGLLERTMLTAPIVFTVAGMLMFPALPSLLKAGFNANVFLGLAEVGLVLLLFTDASQTKLANLRSVGSLPVRLLSIGMLLTIALGILAALVVFPKLSVWEAGILAAVLAPTDAGLGQVIVNSPRVPVRIREALNVEAALNDGLSVPFLLFFMAIAAAKIEGGPMALTQFIVEQLGAGALVGLAIGLGGGSLIGLAHSKEWVARSFQQIGLVTLPLLCLAVCEMVDASMFIAAFVAGLAVQVVVRAIEPDGSTHAAGRDRVDRYRSQSGQRALHGLVWPARFGLDCSRACLPETGTEFTGRSPPYGSQ